MSTIEFYGQLHQLNSSLHSFAYNLTKSQEEAKDLYQETAFRALTNKDKFTPGTNFKAWLFTIMKNIFINNYRKKVKSATIVDTTDNMYYLNSGNVSLENEGSRNLFLEELYGIINQLEDSIRIPFEMHYDGFKYQEIADELNLPLGTVKSRIFFARKELKEQMRSMYGDAFAMREKMTA
ncbi:MAG: RNA polymerase sigma factor [Saprospiraceae bacterium]|nr:RNA polymerase sigma factor [Saprospiraceae bacterium]